MYFFLGILSLSHLSPSHYLFFIPQNKIGRLLDEERKAAMVNNLLVAIVSEGATQPIINTGTLYT